MVGLNLVAYFVAVLSTNWDIVEHIRGAVDRFWYPPHFGIYFSILVAMLVSCGGVILVLQSSGGVGEKLRHHAALLTLTLANIISFTGAPFDAWWHQTYGIDLTAWSPPHLHLIVGFVLVMVSCSVYFLDDLPVDAGLRRIGAFNRQQMLLVYTFALALLLGTTAFFDYELSLAGQRAGSGSISRGLAELLARPRWSYPIVCTAFTLFMFALCTASTRIVGLASAAAGVYTLVRLALVAVNYSWFDFHGVPFYPLVIPALVFDAALALALSRWPSGRTGLLVAGAAALATAVLIVTMPIVWSILPARPELNVQPWSTYWLATGVAGVVFGLAGWWCGTRLRRLRP